MLIYNLLGFFLFLSIVDCLSTPSFPSSITIPSKRIHYPNAVYAHIPRTCLPWLNPIAPRIPCGNGESTPCNITALAEACDTTPGCNAFNTNGFLKSCLYGRCDCDAAPDHCARGQDIYSQDPSIMYGCDTTDVYFLVPSPPPLDFQTQIMQGTLLWGSPEASVCFMPEVGSGYLATTIGWGALYIAGLYNGKCGTVHKARLPTPVAITLENAYLNTGDTVPVITLGGALDTQSAIYRRRLTTQSLAGVVVDVEQRWYAHRLRRNILVTEIALLTNVSSTDAVKLNVSTLWYASLKNGVGLPGDGCADQFTNDLSILYNATVDGIIYVDAAMTEEGDKGEIFNVSMVVDTIDPLQLLSTTTPTLTFLSSVMTSLDLVDGSVLSVHNAAVSDYLSAKGTDPSLLFLEHTQEWSQLHTSRIEVYPSSFTDTNSYARALDIAGHIASSTYYLFSSVRDDWAYGISPGGISSGSYNGAVFMDMDVWMAPALYFLAPSLAASTLEYRANGFTAGTDAELAQLFGYQGDMAAWTAAYEGRPFGCCSGTGGYEDCLEQHVTGDISWNSWQYYSVTGNLTWLRTTGWTILAGAADFHLSRVTSIGNGTYSIKNVLPIDEWCVGSGCGCESPGVDDDAQMNAVARLSLLNAATAAILLDNETTHSQLWYTVGNGLAPLFNTTHGHHNQFTSSTCPDGWGGSHYTGRNTVCPADVELLIYPWGSALNISAAVAKADADLFMPLTCRENAGMTTPIHTIIYVELGNILAAETEFNRSMHAAAYGPFFVRNEVDRHPDIIGASFTNSKFLTGDGGFLQIFLNGFGALRIVNNELLLKQAPRLPTSDIERMVLRNIYWRDRTFTMDISINNTVLQLNNGNTLFVLDNNGICSRVDIGMNMTLSSTTFVWPAHILENGTC